MAEFKSQYKELGFYVKGELKNFSGGRYVTDNVDEIAVLEALTDAHRVDEKPAKVEPKESVSEVKKAEEPVKAPKKPARKTSGK